MKKFLCIKPDQYGREKFHLKSTLNFAGKTGINICRFFFFFFRISIVEISRILYKIFWEIFPHILPWLSIIEVETPGFLYFKFIQKQSFTQQIYILLSELLHSNSAIKDLNRCIHSMEGIWYSPIFCLLYKVFV